MKHKLWSSILSVLAILLWTPQTVHAYTDPGSGALIYQAIYAGILAGTFYLRRLLDRVFTRRK